MTYVTSQALLFHLDYLHQFGKTIAAIAVIEKRVQDIVTERRSYGILLPATCL
ncbi:hypothetical protein Smp_175440 [Schistosoma mansoni]|uniref:Transposase n=1 Tax=Schistosoma mansoni TaxID=6183 RepID=G4VJV3_SCHMA|nr:hypothetical protein Smp_175440 [Schistosoma mansoni]|eukprot:XP_018652308.1 hypothetical protein Smp_175440 [Schistosoma mansoni]